jgi:selenocysteine lyase/cysteine desulfurase
VTTATVSPNAAAQTETVRPDAAAPFDARRAVAGRPLAAVTGAEIQAPLISGGHVRYANLDYGASAPALSVVSAYLNEILPFYASVHRGAGYASQISTSVYENARNIVREFVGGRPDDSVIFTRNTTDSLNLLAGCLPAG